MQTNVLDVRNVRSVFVHSTMDKFGSRIEDVEDRLNEILELVRRHDEADCTDPVTDQVKKGMHHFEHTGATEDASSAERW